MRGVVDFTLSTHVPVRPHIRGSRSTNYKRTTWHAAHAAPCSCCSLMLLPHHVACCSLLELTNPRAHQPYTSYILDTLCV